MPERHLFYSPLAKRDLGETYDYIATELRNPSAAADTVNAMLDGAESLEDFPLVGGLVDNLPFMADEYRFLPVSNYIIFCRVTETSIFIYRILYKRRDYLPLLGLQRHSTQYQSAGPCALRDRFSALSASNF